MATRNWQMSSLVSAVTVIFLASYVHRADSACGGRLFALSLTNLTVQNSPSGDKAVIDQFFISSFKQTTYVKVDIPQIGLSRIWTLEASNNWTITDLKIQVNDLTTPIQDMRYPMGIIIASSNATINVQVTKATMNSCGGFLAMPLYKKPDTVYNYYVPSYNCVQSVLTIVAVQTDTCVSVEQYYNDSTGVLSMRKLQSMTMQAGEVSNLYSSSTDYTGVLVATRKPVAVFGGCTCTQIPVGKAGCDYIIEQVPEASNILSPNNASSTKYILGSIAGRPFSDGFYYRIIAAPTATNFVTVVSVTELRYATVTSVPTMPTTPVFSGPVTLYRGQFLEFRAGFGGSTTDYTVVVVECQTDACEVVQYNPSDTVSSAAPTLISDPFMVLAPPVAYYTRDITFSTSSIYNYAANPLPASPARNFLTIVAKCIVQSTLTLDQTPLVSVPGFSGWITLSQTGFTDYCISWVKTPIADGYHTLTSTTVTTDQQLYTAFVYGHGTSQTESEAAYGYLAGYDNRDALPYSLLPGPWYDINPNFVGVGDATTQAPMATTSPGLSPAVLPDDLPSYTLAWVAEFKALDPGYVGKTPDYLCSNGYYTYFKFRLQGLTQHLAGQCSSNVLITVDAEWTDYYSEYSLSKGKFRVTIQGNGTATLSDVNKCANDLTTFIQNPANWITTDPDGTLYSILSYLRNNDARFGNLTTCAAMYLSNPDGLLTLYAIGWACPSTTGAIFGSALGLLFDSRVTAVALGIAFLLQALLNRRR